MKQQTLAVAASFERFGKQSRRAELLAAMEVVVPWRELVALIEPHYPNTGKGRPPIGAERMLRVYFLQQWFNLSDPAVEDALYESPWMRSFVGMDLGREPAPDETTVCKFRHLLEHRELGKRIFAEVNGYLDRHGLKIGTGTIVDATLLHAPSSTKNKSGERDPEMHQVRKGNQWYFGMKAQVGVDADNKLIHSVEATAANLADSRIIGALLHGNETEVWGDQAYPGSGGCAGRTCTQGRRPDQPALAYQAQGVPGAARREPHQKQNPLTCRACLRHHEASVRLRQGPLSRHPQEPEPTPYHLRARQPVHRSQCPAGCARAEPRLKTGAASSNTPQHHDPTPNLDKPKQNTPHSAADTLNSEFP